MNGLFYCFDLDGTLVSNKKRCHLRGNDWDLYHSVGYSSPPIMATADLLRKLSSHAKVVINTARIEENREKTTQWLEFYDLPFSALLMRPDTTVDIHVNKIAGLQTLFGPAACNTCLAWFEDDPSMIQIGRMQGFSMLQVHE